MGYQARYVQLGDHTVSEEPWDGGENWHMFDISTHQSNRQYCHPGRIEVAVSTDGEGWLSRGRIEHNDLFQIHMCYSSRTGGDDQRFFVVADGLQSHGAGRPCIERRYG